VILFDLRDIVAAREGDRAALGSLVRAAEKPIYNLAIRMLAHPQDAEDATQEILIKIVTNIGSVRDTEATGGWAMRIACRHLVAMRKKGRIEAMRLDFKSFAEDLEKGLTEPSQDQMEKVETSVAIEQVKVACTLAMLTCLSRASRLAYVLGDIFALSDMEAASILDLEPAAYRQRLQRSRKAVSTFVLEHCGNASASAKCRCERRVDAAIASGRIQGNRSSTRKFDKSHKSTLELRPYIHSLEEGRRATEIFRSNPEFESNISDLVLQTIEPGTI